MAEAVGGAGAAEPADVTHVGAAVEAAAEEAPQVVPDPPGIPLSPVLTALSVFGTAPEAVHASLTKSLRDKLIGAPRGGVASLGCPLMQ